MPCFHPLKAFREVSGGVTFSDKGSSAVSLELPCGQCIGCRAERARQWSIRCVHEAQMHDRNCFITLTYAGEKLPSDGSLHVKDWQRFAKRLRKKVGRFRYFMCGEYGDVNLRPHFHACMFGVDWDDKVLIQSNKRGDRLYTSELLEETWGNGLVSSGNLTIESAAYVARYVMKKAVNPKRYGDFSKYSRFNSDTGEVWNVRPEFCVMSRRPGIGKSWFDKYAGDVYPADEVVYDGRRFRPPRFYDGLLEKCSDSFPKSHLSSLEVLKDARRRKVALRKEDLSAERLEVRERVAVARLSQLDRDL